MAIFLAAVTHEIKTNTLEATWLEEVFDMDNNLIEYRRAKCRNYSPLEKAAFEADTGTTIYTQMAGWPDVVIPEPVIYSPMPGQESTIETPSLELDSQFETAN
jgi:hypothetical protein